MTVILRLSEKDAQRLADLTTEGDKALSAHITERIGKSRSTTYRRCSREGCRHSLKRHEGGCSCGCFGFANPLPHRWREEVTEAYRNAAIAWHQDREATAKGYEEEGKEYSEDHPYPSFASFLRGLAQADPEHVDPRFAMEASA